MSIDPYYDIGVLGSSGNKDHQPGPPKPPLLVSPEDEHRARADEEEEEEEDDAVAVQDVARIAQGLAEHCSNKSCVNARMRLQPQV